MASLQACLEALDQAYGAQLNFHRQYQHGPAVERLLQQEAAAETLHVLAQ